MSETKKQALELMQEMEPDMQMAFLAYGRGMVDIKRRMKEIELVKSSTSQRQREPVYVLPCMEPHMVGGV